MKKLILVTSLILSTFVTKASHVMGGMISVANQGPDSTSISLYVVTESGTIMPSSITLQRWKADSQGWYQPDGYITVDGVNMSSHQGFDGHQFISDYIDLDSGKYRFIYTNCCWGMLNNSSNSWYNDVVIATDFWHMPNSYNSNWSNTTPYIENPMWINMQKDSINTMKPIWGVFNCFFVNPENDSVNLEQTELYANYSNGTFVPQTPQSPSNMYVGNDSITFVSSTLGRVGNGFQIDSYHNNYLVSVQRIQWTFIVVNSTLDIEEEVLEKEVEGIWDWSGNYISKDIKLIAPSNLYLIRYSDGSYEKVFLMKQ